MMIGVIGVGIMGSNLARCLSGKGVELGLYNRTRSRAEKVAGEVGARVYDSPSRLLGDSDAVVVFVSDDYALRSIAMNVSRQKYGGEKVFLNASTVTPMASLEAKSIVEESSVVYVEAPVYGSAGEARECRLISIIACNKEEYSKALRVTSLYSAESIYVGEPPRAMAVKLALNNIGLAIPALLAESLMILESWGASIDSFLEIARKLWFGKAVERYWGRIAEEHPPRFRLAMAGKDYWYIASALKAKNLPSTLADALSTLYYTAATHGGYGGKDYPQVARFYLELARKSKH